MAVNIYEMTDTWNDAGTTFDAIKMDVTDTASAAGSKLLNLLVGGASQFAVGKSGNVTIGGNCILFGGASEFNITFSFAKLLFAGRAFVDNANRAVVSLQSSGFYGISSGNASSTSNDVRLYRDAAGTLAQRNGANAQTFNIYNTYTDASNYERGFMKWNANVLQIGTEEAGTGTARPLFLFGGGEVTFGLGGAFYRAAVQNAGVIALTSFIATTNTKSALAGIWSNTAGVLRIAANALGNAASLEFIEQTAPAAPASNAVRIYAEDNGSGKTRLMALFPTGAAQQIAIEP